MKSNKPSIITISAPCALFAKRDQATRANPAQVELHIQRQHKLGERMIGDNDRPSRGELLVTCALLIVAIAWAYVRDKAGLPPF